MKRLSVCLFLLIFFFPAAAAAAPGRKTSPALLPCSAEGYCGQTVSQVIAASLAFIYPRILEPESAATLTLWGLQSISALDPSLSVTETVTKTGNSLSVNNLAGKPLYRATVQNPDNFQAWGTASALLFKDARALSPIIKQTQTDTLLQIFFDELFDHLDPYSRYEPADLLPPATKDLSQGSVGIVPAIQKDRLIIGSVQNGSPAALAGLLPGMEIIALNRQIFTDADDISLFSLTRKFQGKPGSTLKLSVRSPETGNIRTLILKRASLPPDTVTERTFGRILIIKIAFFAPGTAEATLNDLIRAIHSPEPPEGIILNLRNNHGGILQQAAEIAAAFIGKGIIVTTKGRDRAANHIWEADVPGHLFRLPLVILVNGRTASAAEVLAAALADHRRAVVVGSSTLGKGLVQDMEVLPNGAEIFVTWSRLLAPLGWPLQEAGVFPQVCTSSGYNQILNQLEALLNGYDLLTPTIKAERALRSPASLTDILTVRAVCPAAVGSDTDFSVARFLINTPKAYQAALKAVPALLSPASSKTPLKDSANLKASAKSRPKIPLLRKNDKVPSNLLTRPKKSGISQKQREDK